MQRTVGSGGQAEKNHAFGYARYRPWLKKASNLIQPKVRKVKDIRQQANYTPKGRAYGDCWQENSGWDLNLLVIAGQKFGEKNAPSCRMSMQ